MNISSLDPSGELGRLFLSVQSKNSTTSEDRQSNQVGQGRSHDAVALSAFSKDLRDHSAKVAQLPDVRTERVQGIREALQKNQELATSEQVADALIRDTIVNALSFS